MVKISSAILVSFIKVLSVALSTLYILLITNIFSLSVVGEYFVINSVVLLLGIVFKLGFEFLVVKNLDINKHSFRSVLSVHTKQSIGIYFFCLIFTYFFGENILALFNINLLSKDMMLIIVTCGYLYAKTLINATFAQLKNNFLWFSLLNSLLIPLISIIITWITKDIVVSIMLTYIILYILSEYYVRTQPETTDAKCNSITNGQQSICLIQYVSLISQYFILFFVSATSSIEDAAGFSLGQRLSGLLLVILMGVNIVSNPKYAQYLRSGNWVSINELFTKMQRFILLVMLPVVLIFITFSENIILLFSEEFLEYKLLILVLFLGQVINVCTGSVGNLMMIVGYEKQYKTYVITCNLLLLCLAYPISIMYGVVGLGILLSLSIVMINLASFIKVKSILKLQLKNSVSKL